MEHTGKVGVPEDGIFPGAGAGADERDMTVAVRWTGSHPASASMLMRPRHVRQASHRQASSARSPVTSQSPGAPFSNLEARGVSSCLS